MAAAAAADSVKRIKAEATCSICLELLRDPVTTACGHSFCKPCITRICKGREDATCPQCRQPLPEGRLKPNQELRSIVELFRSQAEEKPAAGNMCETHQEPLKLYCNEDQVPICVVCMQSQAHRGHPVVPKEEAVQEYRGKIAEQLGVIKSSCGKLHQFVSEIWKHLPENEQDEERRNLAGACEKLTGLQKRTGIPRQRSADPASQPKESPPDSDSSESDDEETELEGHSGREPGSEPAAEKQEEMGGPVGEEDPTPKYVCSQRSLDDAFHNISITKDDAEPKVDAQQTENRSSDGRQKRSSRRGTAASRKQNSKEEEEEK
ncbi:E3 ubiquitin-protein ligase TRIM17-like [Pelodiscus sinensis]|uniref:E3 ubiquitin-protein ligase TRIM17-like n=1 Tax=Pelodiscus sinensis TaxID=13735 RepID=UPI003F6C0D5D